MTASIWTGRLAILGALALVGCKGSDATPAPAGSASAALAPSASAPTAADVAKRPTPLDPADVAKVVNPKGEAPYAGPTGTLRGTIRIEGDPPPETGLKFPEGCGEGAATYGKLFRVGQDKALADAMVAVTGYAGFVPAREEAAKITIHGCAFNRRTLVVTFGQRIEVANLDQTGAYMPYLDGASMLAIMAAIPQGEPIRLYPQQPGHYMLRDQLPKEFLVSDVFVLAYPTTAVTGLDGQYEIKGIPVGKVTANAYLPILSKTVEKQLEIKEGENTADFTLSYDRAKDLKPKTAPSSSPKPPTKRVGPD
jgi:hypothetical protein